MKRVLALLMIFAMMFALIACNKEVGSNSLTSQATVSDKHLDIPESSLASYVQPQDESETAEFVPVTSSEEYFETEVFTDPKSNELIYYLFHEPMRNTGESYPLIIFLHGLGDTVHSRKLGTATQFVNSLMALENENEKYSAYTLVPATPLADEGWWTDGQREAFRHLIYGLIENYNIDAKRIYISGISMGGMMTCWFVDTMRPDTFAAAVPLSGVSRITTPSALHNTAFRIYHSKYDTVVPPEDSRTLIKRLVSAGHPNAEYIEFEYGDHTSPLYSVYTEQRYAFFDWLFAQRLP